MLKKWLLPSQKKETTLPNLVTDRDLHSVQEDTLVIVLGKKSEVISCSGQLSFELLAQTESTTLADYLYLPTPLLNNYPLSWSNQPVDLCLKSQKNTPIYTRGWLKKTNIGWRLTLIDISDLVIPKKNQEKKIQLFSQLLNAAEKIQSSKNLTNTTRDSLEKLSLNLNIPSLAIVLTDSTDLFIYQYYYRHDSDIYWCSEKKLKSILKLNNESAPSIIKNTHEEIWAIPYTQAGEIKAWLVCGYYNAKQKAPYLNSADWIQLTAQIIVPLLQKIKIEQQHTAINRHHVLQNLQNLGWWEYDAQQELIYLAPNLCKRLNLTEDQPIPLEKWLTLLAPADKEEFQVRLIDVISRETPLDQKLRLFINNKYYWYQCYLQPSTSDEQSGVIGSLLEIQDLEHQKQVAEAANTRLTSLVASAPAIIYLLHYDNGSLTPSFISESSLSVLGWQPEQLEDSGISELVHPDDHDIYFERTRDLLALGVISSRYRLRDNQGNYHWMLDEAKLLRDPLGIPQEVIGLYIDVTDTNVAIENLRDSEERYRVLVEDSPAIICRYQPDLTITFANKKFTQLLDISSLDCQHINLTHYLSEEQLSILNEQLITLNPDSPITDIELCLHIPNQDPIWVVWAQRGMFDEFGSLYEIQAVGRDNTEVYTTRLQLYQSAKMATLGEMATTLTHEINQPLNVMRIALANLLRKIEMNKYDTDYIKKKLIRIEEQIVRVSRIIEHMRVYGRRSELKQIPFNPHNAIEGALSLTRDTLENSGIIIRLISIPLPFVLGHIDQLEQVLINLIVNAKDAMVDNIPSDNTPLLIIRTLINDETIIIEVEDNGGGIPAHQLPKLFDSFFTTKESGHGTGLGLSVSQSILQQMGGELTVKNTTFGALFSIFIPINSNT